MLLSTYKEHSNCFYIFTKYNDAVKNIEIIVINYIRIYNVYMGRVVCRPFMPVTHAEIMYK